MSLFQIAQLVFFTAVGFYLLVMDSDVSRVVAGIAALVCAVLVVIGDRPATPR